MKTLLNIGSCLALLFVWNPPLSAQLPIDSVVARLAKDIQIERERKQLPAVYITLVDAGRVVWLQAFGFADPGTKKSAAVSDVLRVGDLSALFTDIGVLQLAEKGILDLDAPVSRYMPDFRPGNPFRGSITLRDLIAHRSGLVREPPRGNILDGSNPSLALTVASLNETSLVFEPGSHFKFSNAGIAVAGRVLEVVQREAFAEYIETHVLRPLGMSSSSFTADPTFLGRVPKGFLWTSDGRILDAPSYQFGAGPAVNLFSTIGDLGTFIVAINSQVPVLPTGSQEPLWAPHFSAQESAELGFSGGVRNGRRMMQQSGSAHGFSASLAVAPELGIGVAIVTTMGSAQAWSSAFADYSLDLLASRRENRSFPGSFCTTPVDSFLLQYLPGVYAGGSRVVSLTSHSGELRMQGNTVKTSVRKLATTLVTDSKISRGVPIIPIEHGIVFGGDTLWRVASVRPPPSSNRWKGVVGEYGVEHNTLLLQERRGSFYALVESHFSYPLTEVAPDTFAFPEYGVYDGEQLILRRGGDGAVIEVIAAGLSFPRRSLGGENGETFTIVPQKPIDEVRRIALSSTPPREEGEFRKPELIEVVALDSTIHLDIRYATTNNFMQTVFYAEPRAFLQRPAAEALVRAHRWLRQFGYGIMIHDTYRPWYVTAMFWEATPNNLRDFVADPSHGSRHNRGCAADITLYDLSTGAAVPMVSGYDEFSERAYPDYPGGTSLERWNRELLRRAMEQVGFAVYEFEWWHFDYKDWKSYPLLSIPFDQVRP